MVSIKELKDLGFKKFTLSPELDKQTIKELSNNSSLDSELIVYGNTPLFNTKYCLLGKSNKCYPTCKQLCNLNTKYYITDRLNMKFLVVPDNIQTITTVYNSKTTSISSKDFNVTSVRVDILHENIDEINNILLAVKNKDKLEGQNYTNGNLNKII